MTIDLPAVCLPPPEPSPAEVVAEVARAWGIPLADLTGRCRAKRLMLARRAAARACFDLCPSASTAAIGQALGRERTTGMALAGRTRGAWREGQTRVRTDLAPAPWGGVG